MRKIGIIGFGGFAREIGCCMDKKMFNYFISTSEFKKNYNFYKNINVLPLDEFDKKSYNALIAIGDPQIRKKILSELPHDTNFETFIHPKSNILDNKTVNIGEGSIICAGSIITTNIILGKHSILNINSTIGHDTKTKDRFTTFVGVNIAGKCEIGENVCFGTNSCVKEKTKICDNVFIGMGSSVVKNIDTPGIYVGSPVKLLRKY